jgi:hypothetical protein
MEINLMRAALMHTDRRANGSDVVNLLKPTCYAKHQQVQYSRIFTLCYTILVCFVFISQQIANFPLYNAK